MILLDTCILIDVLRGRENALAFVTGLDAKPCISAVTATELVAGCRNVRERRQIDRLIENYVLHDIDREIACLAGEFIRGYGPGHGTDPIDALIAATASVRRTSLATLNLKHFPMFKGLTRPYES